jgi:dTDP-4-dehydrorhamnose reductase
VSWLVTGATGLLGANAMLDLAEHGGAKGVARTLPSDFVAGGFELDLASPDARRGVVERSSARVVLHAAAVSSIEACERDPDFARALNVDAAADLARQAAEVGATFIHISTDAVFDGKVGSYSEDDPTSPTSVYGRTKRDAELAVLDANPTALVARVNFYGWSPSGTRSLAEYFYRRVSAGQEAPGFRDVVVSTLYVRTLVERLRQLAALSTTGVLHVVNDESTSKFEFGRRLAAEFGYDPELVTPSRSSEHLDVARGARLDLDTSRMRTLLGGLTTNQATGMAALVHDHRAGRPAALASLHPEMDVT